MNPIVQSLMKDFTKRQEIQLPDDESFEYFAAYCILNSERLDQGDYRDTLTDKGEEGLDFVAILMNGTLILDPSDLKAIADNSSSLSVKYVFGQAKTSEGWDGGGILKFTRAVKEFFGEGDIGSSNVVMAARQVHRAVVDLAPRMETNPQTRAVFVGSGRADNAKSGNKYMKDLSRDLTKLGMFSQVKAEVIDGAVLQGLYRAATTAATATIEFVSRVTLPPIKGVDQAYIGLLPASQLMKLLTDSESGDIRKSVFEDNVRDFQGLNAPANKGMRDTVRSSDKTRFAVLNNGITIVVRDLRVMADTFTLSDYQVVNGAQTSHVLFESHAYLTGEDDIQVPARLIQTRDEELITEIVTATNSQTQIRADQLNARAIAERNVERFFASMDVPRNLLYERRSRQYDSQGDVVKARVVDRYTLLRATAATFTDEAHLATGYPAQLMNRLGVSGEDSGRRAFLANTDEAIVYYTAASAHYRLDLFLKTQRVEAKYKPGRWHILMAARHLVLGQKVPAFDDRKFRTWVQPFLDKLWDDSEGPRLFNEAARLVERSGTEFSRTNLRNAAITSSIQQLLAQRC